MSMMHIAYKFEDKSNIVSPPMTLKLRSRSLVQQIFMQVS